MGIRHRDPAAPPRRAYALPASAARALTIAVAVALILGAPARGQLNPPPPRPPDFNVDLYYTIALDGLNTGSGLVEYSALRTVHIEGETIETAQVTRASTIAELTPYSPGGLIFDADGRFLVAASRNSIIQVDPAVRLYGGPAAVVLPACREDVPQDSPVAIIDIAADPAPDRAWVVTSGNMTGGLRVAPDYETAIPMRVFGDDSEVTSLAFNTITEMNQPFTRCLYAAPGRNADSPGSVGFLDLRTGLTTRLFTNLNAARVLISDPFTGHVFAFKGPHIAQIDARAVTPRLVAQLSIGDLVVGGSSVNIVDATADGRGRLFAVASDGRLFVLDLSRLNIDPARARLDDRQLRWRLFELEPGPPAGYDRSGYPDIRGVAPLTGPGRARGNECLWHNGERDGISGQLSQVNAEHGDPETADDLYLEPGRIYRLDFVTATLATNAPFPKARLEIYDDCNGLPSSLIAKFDSLDVVSTGITDGPYRVLTARFALGGIYVDAGSIGRTLWVSVRGVGLASGPEEWFWSTAGNRVIKGSPGVFRSAEAGYPDWTPITDFGCGCSDFAFTVYGDSCKVLLDTGMPDPVVVPRGVLSQIASTVESAIAADDFVVPPCSEPQKVCYLRAYVYSNCNPVRGRFELWADSCHTPAGWGPGAEPLYTAAFARVTDLGEPVTIDGRELRTYCVEAFGLDWLLLPGRNYWLAPVGDTTFAQSKRTYAAIGRRCDRGDCLLSFHAARARGLALGLTHWSAIYDQFNRGRDLSLVIGLEEARPEPIIAPNPCPADLDRSGQVTVQDLFNFLQAWFAGCP